MKAGFVLAALACLLYAPTAGAAPFLQAGYDAARTGATPDPGPATDDVVFTVALGAPPAFAAVPLIIDGAVYVMTARNISRVDLATAEVVELVDLSHTVVRTPDGRELAGVSGFASDGRLLFLGRMGGVDAYGLDGSAPVWSWSHPGTPSPSATTTSCAAPAVRADHVYVVCGEEPASDGTSYFLVGGVIHAAKLDAATGEPAWTWTYDAYVSGPGPDPFSPSLPTAGTSLPAAWLYPPVVVGSTVIVTIEQPADPRGTLEDRFFALDDATAELRWTRQYGDPEPSAEEELVQSYTASTGEPMAPTGSEDLVFLRLRTLVALDPLLGTEGWEVRPSAGAALGGNGDLALGGGSLYVAMGGHLSRFDAATGTLRWASPLPGDTAWSRSNVLVTNATVIGLAPGALYAFDAADGALRWRHAASGALNEFAIGEGVLAYLAAGSQLLSPFVGERPSMLTLTVLGHTPASLAARAEVSALYPTPGAPVTVDLSPSSPGVFGPATDFRADWGDGTVDDWQTSPFFNHTYGAPGERTARFFVRNDAGQTASITRTIHVGGTPPRDLNLAQKAFDRDNQDLTFGVLGIALAVGGGLFAVTRSRTRRGRVQRELEAIEAAFVTTRDRPVECEAALAERRARVRGLGLDGKLDQSEGMLLERRIDELAQELRLESIDAHFPFLPVSMARTLRDMRADGRIVAWEREHFLRALDEDAHMTRTQKKRVREQIDAWFARDAGAPR